MMLEHLGKKIDEMGLPDGLVTAINRFDAKIDKIRTPAALISFFMTAGNNFLTRLIQ